MRRNKRLIVYGIALWVGLLASVRLWGPGMVNTRGGGDSPFLLQRTLDMAYNLRHGVFPSRWMAHAAYDLGYPFFNHYAALPYYLSGGLTVLGISPIVAIQTTQTLGFILAALTMALWAQRVYRPLGDSRQAVTAHWLVSILAVVAYTFAPFHLVNVYVRGDSLSEFYALVWYPLILWALDRLSASVDSDVDFSLRRRAIGGRVIVAALAYAALILTHNVSAMIFSPFAVLYVLLRHGANGLRIQSTQLKRALSKGARLKAASLHWGGLFSWGAHFSPGVLFSPFVLGILLTTWFWLPAVAETGYGQMGEAFTAGYFHYSKHFRGINLVQPSLLFNYDVAVRPEDAGPFTMGLSQTIMTILGTVALIGLFARTWKRRQSLAQRRLRLASYLFLLLGLLISTLMITPLSRPLWDHLPLLEITQFPWRFLSVQALFTSTVIAALGMYPLKGFAVPRPRFSILLSVGIIGVLIAATMLSLHPDRLLITDKDVTWDRLLLYESFTGNIGTTIRYEYLPQDVVPRLYIAESVVDGELPSPVVMDVKGTSAPSSGDTLKGRMVRRTPVKQVWEVDLTQDASVVFPLNWWPGWRAVVDGRRAETRPVIGSGRLATDLSAGTHTVVLRLRDTPLRIGAEVISLLTVLACLIGGAMLREGRARGNDVSHQPHAIKRSGIGLDAPTTAGTPTTAGALTTIGALLLSLLLCLFFNRVIVSLPEEPQAYAFDFLQMPYPHAGPLDFKVVKLWFEPLFIQAEPGEVISIPLQGGQLYTAASLTATVRLVSPASPRHGVSYGLAEMSFSLGNIGDLTSEASDAPGARRPLGPIRVPKSLELALPDDLSRGLYLVELRVYEEGAQGSPVESSGRPHEYFAHTAQGHPMGPVYIGAIRVPHGPPHPADMPIQAVFKAPGSAGGLGSAGGPGSSVTGFVLHTVEANQVDPGTLPLKMAWSVLGPTPMTRNWSLSLRLLDATGHLIAQRDLQPGYGYLPTTLWRPGERITDYPELALPEGLAPGDYILRIVTYLRATMAGGGETDTFVTLSKATLREPQDVYGEGMDKDAKSLCEAAGVSLVNVDWPAKVDEGSPLDCYVAWYAEANPNVDLRARWEVVDAEGRTVAVTAGPLSPGSQTTSWPRHAWVRAPLHIDLPHTLPDTPYRLHVTLLSKGTQPGSQTPLTTCSLTTPLPIEARVRHFDTPSPMYAHVATFNRIGGASILRLLGYDLAYGPEARPADGQDGAEDTLSLTLWWQATEEPIEDYKRFVHLFNPETEQILAQDDAMPRSWAYPTSWWVAGEVVSETVTLDLGAVSPGTYRLAVGWYDPEAVEEGFGSARLLALDAEGDPLPMNRVVLDSPVIRE